MNERDSWSARAGLKFMVNLSDYVDTGLFLDHRLTRQMVREAASEKRFLNLFAYTGSFTVYAAAGGAASTDDRRPVGHLHRLGGREPRTQRLSRPATSAGAERYLAIPRWLVGRMMCGTWPSSIRRRFRTRKGTEEPWDVQRDHGVMLQAAGRPHRARRRRLFQHQFPPLQARRGVARRLHDPRNHAANDSGGLSQRTNPPLLATRAKAITKRRERRQLTRLLPPFPPVQ